MSIPVRLFEFVLGSLLPLTDFRNWEQHGSVTPEDAAEYFDEWLYSLLDGGCNVNRPFITGILTQVLSVDHNTYEPVPWLDGHQNQDEYFERVGQEIEILKDGYYTVRANITFQANAVNIRRLRLSWSSGQRMEQVNAGVQGETPVTLVVPRTFWAQGTVLTFYAYQNSNSTINAGQTSSLFGPSTFAIEAML